MFAASPGLHGVEHPIYDIWLTIAKAPDATVVSAQPDPPKSAAAGAEAAAAAEAGAASVAAAAAAIPAAASASAATAAATTRWFVSGFQAVEPASLSRARR